jgi:hypothetical protein
MNIEAFCARHGRGEQKRIESVVGRWNRERELDALLHTHVGAGVILGDLLVGDGLLDQVSPELKDAFSELMGEKADSFNKVRQILLDKLENGDSSVLGLVNKIKGQVGENRFIEELGGSVNARLAAMGNQEAWDVAIDHDWGTQYVQVKMHSGADGVIRHMKEIDSKLSDGHLIYDGESVVKKIDFAVPENIADEVTRKAQALGLDINVISIRMNASEAADVVWDGVNNVGPKALENFFDEILSLSGNAALLHGLATSFLIYKSAKQRDEIVGDITQNTAITAGGFCVGGSIELLLHKVGFITAGPAGVLVLASALSTCAILRRLMERTDCVQFLRSEIEALRSLNKTFRSSQPDAP